MLTVTETGLGVWGTDVTERWVAGERRGVLVLPPLKPESRPGVIKVGNHSSFLSEGVASAAEMGEAQEGDG